MDLLINIYKTVKGKQNLHVDINVNLIFNKNDNTNVRIIVFVIVFFFLKSKFLLSFFIKFYMLEKMQYLMLTSMKDT